MMKKKSFLSLIALLFCSLIFDVQAQIGAPELELRPYNAVKQLKRFMSPLHRRFDMSGIVYFKGKLWVVADKKWNKRIYQIDTSAHKFVLKRRYKLPIEGVTDFEGIDIFDQTFYVIDERKSNLVTYNEKQGMKIIDLPWQKMGINHNVWNNNGLEGIATDTINKIIYLAKEHTWRQIYCFNPAKNELSVPFRQFFTDTVKSDISELKYENGYLYLMERSRHLITRINTYTGELKSVSYGGVFKVNNQHLYEVENPAYGIAEAFLLTPTEIWIGIDNNGEVASDLGVSHGLKRNKEPSFFIFKRPTDF